MQHHVLMPVLLISLLSLSVYGLSSAEAPIDVPYYTQGKDAPWADDTLGLESTVTIRTHGCALTAISMVFSHFTKDKLTPPVVNRWLKENGGFLDDPDKENYSGRVVLNWPSLRSYGDGWVYTRFDWRVKPADILLIQYYLDQRVPVIAEVLYNGAPHYVVLTDYADGDFSMLDPEIPDERSFNAVYDISDNWGSGPSRNIYGIRVLYPQGFGKK
jgi:hypothetical protein